MAVYLMVASNAATPRADGSGLAARGEVVARILWDGETAYTPPSGTALAIDDGTAIGETVSAATLQSLPK